MSTKTIRYIVLIAWLFSAFMWLDNWENSEINFKITSILAPLALGFSFIIDSFKKEDDDDKT